ncbi:MAG TPA: radical SAM protein [Balneolales bacterium]|nr:radical SAM protein [Balneolales bacterium]
MTKVLLGQSYYLRFDAKLWRARQPYPPLGTLYAASLLRSNGYKVSFFDAMIAESETEWAQALDREGPDFAVLYEDNFNYLSKMCLLRMREAAFKMIDMAKIRGIPIVVCGSDATDHAGLYLNRGARYVISGEGEQTLLELIGHVDGKTNTGVHDVPGLIYHAPECGGTLLRTCSRRLIRDLDNMPFPAWDLIEMDRYRQIWYSHHGYFSLNMVTSRGCPYHCNWCSKPIWGQHYHYRSPENVVKEMELLSKSYRADEIWFMDDIFGLKPGWLHQLADILQAKELSIPFKCLNRPDLLLTKDRIRDLKRAGCRIVWVGAESGSQQILDAMEKGTKVEQLVEVAHKLHDAGIQSGYFLQFGYPGEQLSDILKTIKMVYKANPDDIGISVSYPLPGTPFFEKVKQQLGTKQNWIDSDDLAMMYNGPYHTRFYRALHQFVHKLLTIRKRWQKISDFVRSGNAGYLPGFRQLAGAVYHILSLPLLFMRLVVLSRLSPGDIRWKKIISISHE